MTAHVVTPPAIEPVSLAEMKAHLRLTTGTEDDVVSGLIKAAREHVEQTTRRVLISQIWRLYLDDWPPGRIVQLHLSPVSAIQQILLYRLDGTPVILDPADYALQRGAEPPRVKVSLGSGIPSAELAGIEVDFTAGYGPAANDVPAPLRQAVKLLAAHWFESREAASEQDFANVPYGFDRLVMANRVPLL
ncbi:putative phiE125 gp8 family phage protein [Roseibium hamelinense]|uniref:Putative phiE125 gp8 family phage protein n=1 Tax=Roseibium hamelinense TaxID=150831 RepID=A0A562T755_9HYPH|nr:head-tail connector protein [Roseibium hamelinense]MTI43694.1 hypothetical protein [Roseibium hamelinense]TWI89375.1 putative phiE125 gp8 family phage protein [Roseibium hamelinense]